MWDNFPRMKKGPIFLELRNTPLFVVVGTIVGIFIATIRHLSHDHRHMLREEERWHFVSEMLVAMLAGATLIGGAYVVRSWWKRRPQFSKSLCQNGQRCSDKQ
ncbi:hypothetical protein DC522_31840 [Microvirga sp. KLBC 81]|nr:hypothetical protein DC522_31840 [Microvirga sp. KLBC 81]